MEDATQRQVIALKRFVRNPELSGGLMKGKRFDELSKEEASELIKRCYEHQNVVAGEGCEFGIKFSQNYRNGDGSFKTVALTDEELAEIRSAHRRHCEQVIEECSEDFSDDRELQFALFDKSADKIFTWIQQALDEKVRETRGGSNGSQHQ